MNRIVKQMQPDFNQRQFENWAGKKIYKSEVKGTSSLLKKTGLPSDLSKPTANTIISGVVGNHRNIDKPGQQTTTPQVTIKSNFKTGSIVAGAGGKVSYSYDVATGTTKSRVRESWSQEPSASVEVIAPIVTSENTKVELRSSLEKERGKKVNAEMKLNTQIRF